MSQRTNALSSAIRSMSSPRRLAAVAAVPVIAAAAHLPVTVRPGDTLSAIARAHCGTAADWTGIYAASRKQVGADPNLILPGERLTVRCRRAPVTSAPRPPAGPGDGDGGGAVTASRVTAPPPYSGGVLSPSQVGSYWLAAGGPAWAETQAESVAWCESGDNPAAYNPSGADGLWQILGQVVPGSLSDPAVNAANAVAKFTASGDTWAQWVCQP